MEEREISSQNVKKLVLCEKNLKKEQLTIVTVTAEIRFQNALKIRVKNCMVTSHMKSDTSLLFMGLVTIQVLCFQPTVLASSVRFLLKFCQRNTLQFSRLQKYIFLSVVLSEKSLRFLNNNWTCLQPRSF